MYTKTTLFHFFVLCIFCTIISATRLIKRSLPHQDFPNHALRYTHPDICEDKSDHISGYFELPNGKNYFFWFFESRSNPEKDPVALWLNGGPGCSSLLGLLMEIGPCRVNDEGTKSIYNEDSWTNKANVLFLDQPVNSGYSYSNGSSNVLDSSSASNEVYIFLQLFYKEFPKFAKSDLHVAGESYAGHYLPAIGSTIYEKNKNNTGPKINLKSIIMGNGLTDPLTQYQYFKPMACESSYNQTLITSPEQCKQLELSQNECKVEIEKCYKKTRFSAQDKEVSSITACIIAASVCNVKIVKSVLDATNTNMYDVRKKCEAGPMCYNYFGSIKSYLDRSDIKTALGVNPSVKIELCNNAINNDFQGSGDWMRPYVYKLTDLLNNGIRILAYAGDTDFMVGWMGVRAWTMNVDWKGKENYNKKNDTDWKMNNGTVAGTIRKSSNLAFVRLFNAGHMAPYDQPKATLDMFNRWISNSL